MTWILNNSRKTPPLSQSDFTKELLAKNGMKLNGLGLALATTISKLMKWKFWLNLLHILN
jgi:hypothetical protein